MNIEAISNIIRWHKDETLTIYAKGGHILKGKVSIEGPASYDYLKIIMVDKTAYLSMYDVQLILVKKEN